jgi:DNA-binding CsgD family transcriptional regulator
VTTSDRDEQPFRGMAMSLDTGAVPRRSAPFIGRSDELATLRAALDRAWAGAPAVAVVAGEAGIGKSRLLAELATTAVGRGALVLRADCVPLSGAGVPFGPVAALLRDAVRQSPTVVSFIGDHAAELGHLLPAALVDAPPLTGELAQLRLLDALRAVVAHLGAERTAVLVVEDLQWADRSSADALVYLTRTLSGAGVLIAASLRPDALPRTHPLHPAVTQLGRAAYAERIDLGPLTEAELARQAAALLAAEPSSALVDELVLRSGGNPFFVEELVAAHRRGEGRGVPAALSDLLMAELDPLPARVRSLLGAAAAIDRELPVELLAAALDADPSALVDDLRVAVEAGVLVPAGTQLAFRHELLREAVLAALLPGERASAHARVARAITERPGLVAQDTVAGKLALHWYLAGEPRRALAAAVAASAQARALGAPAEAARHGSLALELWDAVPDAAAVAGVDRVDLLLRLADDSVYGGGTPAHVRAEQALGLLDPAAEPARHATVTARLARYELMAGLSERALGSIARAGEAARGLSDLHARARIAAERAQILMNCDRYDEARTEAATARELARGLGDRLIEVHAAATLGVTLCALGDWTDGLAELDRVHPLTADLRGHGAAEVRSLAALACAFLPLVLGLADLALDRAVAGARQAAADGLHLSFGTALQATAAAAAVTLGDLDSADALLAEIPRPGLHRFAQFRSEARVGLELARGNVEAARQTVADSAAGRDMNAPTWLCYTGPIDVALDLDEPERAGDEARRLLAIATDRGMVWPVPHLAALGLEAEARIAQQARAAGDAERAGASELRIAELAAAAERAVEDFRSRAGTLPPDALVWTAVGRAWHARREEACAAWSAAAAAGNDAGMPLVAAQARVELARARLAVGERAEAARELASALDVARRRGATGLARVASELAERARLGSELAEAADGRGTGERLGLTGRELQVLRLVADGRTNREIGEALFMSPKTASVHVSALLRKLDVPGRRDAARLARRLGLA